ncbi:hypothetical protein [Nonomuraea basaltis]|uniref:hypothetical protein n=1 Tax=Nonomuraea basaltis TaxID=2495887 RepID=UPI00110C514F|nr:hypothetical protein [Nonomuraea basaltis]TMR92856.1 hypothetical protein EJK15_42640 [Nonomuraea basaltis]
MMKDLLAAIGALSVLAAAGLLALSALSIWAQERRSRKDRDRRAARPAEQVANDTALWSDFFLDHDLHKVLQTPKEWRE